MVKNKIGKFFQNMGREALNIGVIELRLHSKITVMICNPSGVCQGVG